MADTYTTAAAIAEVLEIGDLVVHYLPRAGLLGLRYREHPAGSEAWFPLAPELVGPFVAWLADHQGERRQWGKGDPQPPDVLDVVDNLGRAWRRVRGAHLWRQADGRGGVRTWRELTIGHGPLVEAGERS